MPVIILLILNHTTVKQFRGYAQKPFAHIKVGKEKVRKFGEVHIATLEKEANPAFEGILAESKTLYDDMFGGIVSRDEMETNRQAATIQLNQKAAEFQDKAIEIEPLVAFKLKKSGFYEEFFPHGTTEIHGLTQANTATVMLRFERASTKHATTLGNDYSHDFNAIRLAYQSAVDLQKGLKGSVKINIPDFAAKQAAFYDQIYKNILVIATFYYKTPEKMLAYFDESILEVRKHKSEDGGAEPYNLEIAPSTTETAEITFAATDTILLSNISDEVSVFYYGGNTPNQAPAADATELAAGEEVEIAASSLGKYLLLQNRDAAKVAEVEIMMV